MDDIRPEMVGGNGVEGAWDAFCVSDVDVDLGDLSLIPILALSFVVNYESQRML